ncbi:MAG: 3-isopropylmalate dehydratase small subunit [Candidatus Diapherotrites archaeon]|jgi:3-isopropylmalate/(R)-2-methylmalate dehydratase small subunit|uniref:3-isopropylmalate dehydratase n=1 Tax=Candidatus Iainarchaeum sp. TaxID=3101447 RepID=A0A8T5GEX8_9ARCH|nr:3-isopropylmalate dehydratase small subunit [Candidatus Diapherotrites archaeon]
MSELKIEENIIENIIGKGIPKTGNDQNTDDIIPARFMKEITFANMGEYAYFDERIKDGKEIAEHPLNKYKGASILIGGANYGCGSSREHAPQALHRYGIKAIVAESFAEIFAGNCASLGVVGVMIPRAEIDALAEVVKENPETEITIDLNSKVVKYLDKEVSLEMVEGRRQSFLNGTWDALTILQQNKEGIEKVENELAYLKF